MSTYDNLQGALELLILTVLRRGPTHGYAIATAIQQMSDDVLRVEAGSMYPALHRMTESGLLKAEWTRSDVGRRARLYALTRTGRRRLEHDEEKWRTTSAAVVKVLQRA